MAAGSTAASIHAIRIVWRKGLTVCCWHRIFRYFWLRRRRWRLLFDRRIGRRRYVGAVCERVVYRSKLGKLESPIGFAVGRHCGNLSWLIPAASGPEQQFKNGNGKEGNITTTILPRFWDGIGSTWLVLRCDCLFGRLRNCYREGDWDRMLDCWSLENLRCFAAMWILDTLIHTNISRRQKRELKACSNVSGRRLVMDSFGLTVDDQ